jgi:EAL domain-containing protein (putative c-di-GMP-specific phosphodiesterase class I)
LNQLPFDALKIDRAFAMQMKEDGGLKLVRAMMNLATGLDRGVVLEGIETAEQRDLYRGLGGKLAQGYFFSRPLPLEQLLVLMKRVPDLPWR